MNAYPAQYKNLLIKAGLLMMPGFKEVRGLVLDQKLKEFDESSQTFRDSVVPEVDHRRTSEYYRPVTLDGIKIEGDWRIGLTADEVKIINEECGVPIFTKDTRLFLHHGKLFDMENPQHVAEYRILDIQGLVAPGPKQVGSNQRFFWHDQVQEQKEKENTRKIKRTAIELDENLTDEEKRSMLKLLNFEKKIGIAGELSATMLRESFADMAYNRPSDLVAVSELPNPEARLLLHELVSAGVLFKEGDKGTISRPSGMKLADTFDEGVYLLLTDTAIRYELEGKLGQKTGYGQGSDKPALKGKPEPVRKYDTVVHDEKAIGYWNREACMQYFEDNRVPVKLTEADGIDRWRNLVVKHHRREESPDFATQPQIAPFSNEAVALELSERVLEWNKTQCVAFLAEHAESLLLKGFDGAIQPKDGVVKARQVVIEALSLFTPDEVTMLLDDAAVAANTDE